MASRNTVGDGMEIRFVLGLLTGTILGCALGMLFAPQGGSELRNQIGDLGDTLARAAKEKASEAIGAVVEEARQGATTGATS
jgi:gas vesicle protein